MNEVINVNLPANLFGDKQLLVWLSHDVDWVKKNFIHNLYYTYKQKRLYHLKELFFKENRYWNFDKIMELESKYNAKSTFFFLHETMKPNYSSFNSFLTSRTRYSFHDKKIESVIRTIDNAGWEIGLHGSYLSYQNYDLLKYEKELLDNILGKKVNGIRQHYLNLNIPKTWQNQEKLGFKYDSSFGLKNDVGFKDNIYYPFMPFKKSSFTVFPLVLMDGYLEKVAKYNYIKATKIIDNLFEIAIARKTILSVLWHNRSIDNKEFPLLYRLYEYILKRTVKLGGEFIMPNQIINCTDE